VIANNKFILIEFTGEKALGFLFYHLHDYLDSPGHEIDQVHNVHHGDVQDLHVEDLLPGMNKT
jgi:hypothetical protein